MAKRRKRRRSAAACPCGRDASYMACCGRYHRGQATAETPTLLMRSRYAAYARGEVDYIVGTTDPEGPAWNPDPEWRAEIRRFGREMDFLGVEILEEREDGDFGEVRFRASLRRDGEDASFTERSEFVRRDGRWLYHRGDVKTS